MTATTEVPALSTEGHQVTFAWLWITHKCQQECIHCYAESGPTRDHGTMTFEDWCRVIDQCAGLGVQTVEFIGGEVTMHPDLGRLIEYAAASKLNVIVYTNLVHVPGPLWTTFQQCKVTVATSYHTDDRKEHQQISGGHDTLRQIEANIAHAVELGLEVTPGGVDILERQRTEEAKQRLIQIGVRTPLGFDKLREVGRGNCGSASLDPAQLCGQCTNGKLVVQPDGKVAPCVFSTALEVGDAGGQSLKEIVNGGEFTRVRAELDAEFATRAGVHNPACQPVCAPTNCAPTYTCNPKPGFTEVDDPTACKPNGVPSCYPGCNPHCRPSKN